MSVPTDPYELLHFNMVRAHETFKLGYDTILPLLSNPPTKDLANFLGYCEAWAQSIECHHNSEEEIVFPFLNEKMDFSGEAEAHKVIHAALDSLLDLIHTGRADHTKFDAAKIKELMIAFREPLYAHLDEEVEHIAAKNLKDAGFTAIETEAMVAHLEKYAKSHGDPFLLVPYMRSHTPSEYKDTWPNMPWILRKLVIPYLLAKKHSGYWKYAPYSMS